MLKTGILNPQINALLARVRHTNMLMIETVDITLVDDIPSVLQVLAAIRHNFDISHVYMGEQFRTENNIKTQEHFAEGAAGIPVSFEPHIEFKKRVPQAIGLIRTGDTTQYANMSLVSGRVNH